MIASELRFHCVELRFIPAFPYGAAEALDRMISAQNQMIIGRFCWSLILIKSTFSQPVIRLTYTGIWLTI